MLFFWYKCSVKKLSQLSCQTLKFSALECQVFNKVPEFGKYNQNFNAQLCNPSNDFLRGILSLVL